MKRKILYLSIFVLSVAMLFGCAGTVKNMSPVSSEKIMKVPSPGKAMVIFLRPSSFGYAIQSSVFEIVDDKPILLGIVAAKKKVVSQLEPGEHLFMVIGESADFMSADLAADKTYYALVTPRMGVWKARFSLKPVNEPDLSSGDELTEWLKDCEWVEMNTDSDLWVKENISSIQSKQTSYYKKWMEKDEADRPKLVDGR